jgi:ABC-type Na+ efflux pump permease subunit
MEGIISLVVGLAGLFAFSAHIYLIRKGREEFNTSISLAILVATLIVSIIQMPLNAYTLVA